VSEPELLLIAKLSFTPSYLRSIQKTLMKRLGRINQAVVPCRKALEILEFLLKAGPEAVLATVQQAQGVLRTVVNSRIQTFENHREYIAESQARDLANKTLALAGDSAQLETARADGARLRDRIAAFPLDPELLEYLRAFAEKEAKDGRRFDAIPATVGAYQATPAGTSARPPPAAGRASPTRAQAAFDSDSGNDDELDFDPRARAKPQPPDPTGRSPQAAQPDPFRQAPPAPDPFGQPPSPRPSAGGWAPQFAPQAGGYSQGQAGGYPQAQASGYPSQGRAPSPGVDDLLFGPAAQPKAQPPPAAPQPPQDQMAGVILDLSAPSAYEPQQQRPASPRQGGGMLDEFGDLAQIDLHQRRTQAYGRPDQARGSGPTLAGGNRGFPG
jgi:hypothetical protein